MRKIEYVESEELPEKEKKRCFENNMLERKNQTINLRMMMKSIGIFVLWSK